MNICLISSNDQFPKLYLSSVIILANLIVFFLCYHLRIILITNKLPNVLVYALMFRNGELILIDMMLFYFICAIIEKTYQLRYVEISYYLFRNFQFILLVSLKT